MSSKTKDKENPEVCSIEEHFNPKKGEELENTENLNLSSKIKKLENIKGIKRPNTCSIETHQDISQHSDVFDIEEEIPTFGRNVSVSAEEREKLLKILNKNKKTFKDTDSIIEIEKNGPYLVKGNIILSDIAIKTNEEGQSIGFKDNKVLESGKTVYLCRCGHSKNMPFCDGMHEKIDFDGTCTAKNEPYLETADIYQGAKDVYLLDKESLCAIVRFCDPDGSCWNLVKSEQTVPLAEGEATKCCSGRLTLVIDDKLIEPEFEEEIQALFDTERDVLGPLWVKGGIPIKNEETDYERRNRVTLCRCGRSGNKPFCDGMHLTCPKVSEKVREEEE